LTYDCRADDRDVQGAKAIPLPKEEIQDSNPDAQPDTAGYECGLTQQSNRFQPDVDGSAADREEEQQHPYKKQQQHFLSWIYPTEQLSATRHVNKPEMCAGFHPRSNVPGSRTTGAGSGPGSSIPSQEGYRFAGGSGSGSGSSGGQSITLRYFLATHPRGLYSFTTEKQYSQAQSQSSLNRPRSPFAGSEWPRGPRDIPIFMG
jgi:hypothetical protein